MNFVTSCARFAQNAWSSYVEYHTRAPFKHRYLALIGLVAFPGYYFVWTHIFPQPYENLWLRLIGVGLCAAYLLKPYWPRFLKPWFLPFTYAAMMAGLPVFFTFMLLMNDANPAWLMSTMASFVFVVLVYDMTNVPIVSILGSILGILLFFAVDGIQPLPEAYLWTFPVLIWTVAAVLFLAYSERMIAHEKFVAAKLLASNIAHEMRTPLLGIRLDAERLYHEIDAYTNLVSWAQENGYSDGSVNDQNLELIKQAIRRTREHAISANLVIDMLLTNVGQSRVASNEFAEHTYRSVIDTTFERYHFRKGQRARVSVDGDVDRCFWGSDILFIHVFFNLLKNAFKAIDERGDGDIKIRVSADGNTTRITFTDTGMGIREELQPYVFMPFVTGGSRMQGTGVGLAFVKLVVESFGGNVRFKSRRGVGTTFIIELPADTDLPEMDNEAGQLAPAVARFDTARVT